MRKEQIESPKHLNLGSDPVSVGSVVFFVRGGV